MPFVREARPGKKLGRPRSKASGVWHVKRPGVKSRIPMHITLKLLGGLPSLRRPNEAGVVFSVLADMRSRHEGLRIVHWSILSNHLHLIVEGDGDVLVSRAMQGFAIATAKRLNKLWGRKGTVFADRYHRTDLPTPRQVYNALKYVFANQSKHTLCQFFVRLKNDDGSTTTLPWVDEGYSSARTFEYWRDSHIRSRKPDERVARPRSWLLQVGYQRGGMPLQAR